MLDRRQFNQSEAPHGCTLATCVLTSSRKHFVITVGDHLFLQMNFLALLSNAGASLLKVRLPKPFSIARMKRAELVSLLEKIEGLPTWEIETRLDCSYSCIEHPKAGFLVITGEIDDPFPDYKVKGAMRKSMDYRSAFVQRFDDCITLLRLLKEGWINSPAHYFYHVEGDEVVMDESVASDVGVQSLRYTLSPTECATANWYLRHYRFPFEHEYLRLATHFFNRSYDHYDSADCFLQLSIALEVLFNEGGGELRQRISRHVAVLLSASVEHGQELQRMVRELYDVRSHLVHTGNRKKVGFSSVFSLREILRRVMIVIGALGYSKDQLLKECNAAGFGHIQRTLKRANKAT